MPVPTECVCNVGIGLRTILKEDHYTSQKGVELQIQCSFIPSNSTRI